MVTRVNAQARAVQRQNLTDKGRKITRKWAALNIKVAPLAKINPRSARVEWCQNIKEEFRNNHAIHEDNDVVDDSDGDSEGASEEEQEPLERQELQDDPQDNDPGTSRNRRETPGGRQGPARPTPGRGGRSRQQNPHISNQSGWTEAQREAYNRYQLVGGVPPAFLSRASR